MKDFDKDMFKSLKLQKDRTPAKIILITIAIVLFGVAVIYLYQQEPKSGTQPETPTELFSYSDHVLLVASQNGLVKLAYNSQSQTYEKQTEVMLSGITGMVSYDNDIFVTTKDEVVKLNGELEKQISKKFGEIGALATDNKNIFVAADGSFIALDKNLEELSRVNLKLEHFRKKQKEKNAHDILIHNNIAYLLDNRIMPLFILRVDIENPKNIQVTEKIELMGIGSHLEAQWLNPKFDQWFVLESFSHLGGSGQTVNIYPMNKGKRVLATQDIFFYYRREERMEGLDVRGITNLPPLWAIVLDANEKYHLAQVESKRNEISLPNLVIDLGTSLENQYEISLPNLVIDLGTSLENQYTRNKRVIIKRKGNYLFVAPVSGSLLKIITIEQKPEIIFSKNLKEYNVQEIVDILPY